MTWRRLIGLSKPVEFFDMLKAKQKAWNATPGDGIVPLRLATPSMKVTREPKRLSVMACRDKFSPDVESALVLMHGYQVDERGREKRN